MHVQLVFSSTWKFCTDHRHTQRVVSGYWREANPSSPISIIPFPRKSMFLGTIFTIAEINGHFVVPQRLWYRKWDSCSVSELINENHFPTFLAVIILRCREGLEVTDDVSIVEHLGHPVFITEGAYTNIKVLKFYYIYFIYSFWKWRLNWFNIVLIRSNHAFNSPSFLM